MGWTRGREVQCGCGWEGTALDTYRAYRCVEHPTFPEPVLVEIKDICPMCYADVTSQAIRDGFKNTIRDLPKVTGKVFRWDYYERITLNGD